MKDFFVSYTKNDYLWAAGLDGWLKDAGYSTVIQSIDFSPGSNFVLEMHQALQSCQRTLLVLSPDFLLSPFTASEWAASFAQDPTGARRKVVGAMVRSCAPQGLLAAITHIRLYDQNVQQAQATFLAGIKAAVTGVPVRREAVPPPATATSPLARRSIRQTARGRNSVQIGEMNGDFIQTQKVTRRTVVQPDERHLSDAQALRIRELVDQLAETATLRGEPDTHGKWYSALQRKFRVPGYRLIPRDAGEEALQWLRMQSARNRPRLRRAANGQWRTQLYAGIYARAKDLQLDDATLHALASEKLNKPVLSFRDLGERDLAKFHGIVYGLARARTKVG
jgi:hypothetical protein